MSQRKFLISGTTTKEAWFKLRNCHRDAIRRQNRYKNKNGDVNDSEIKQWRYQQQMSFLMPYMNIRDFNSYKTYEFDTDNLTIMQEHQSNIDSMHQSNFEQNESQEDTLMPNTIFVPETSLSAINDTDEDIHPLIKRRKTDNNEEESSLHVLVKNYLDRREERSEQKAIDRQLMYERSKKDEDPLYHFFMSMYTSTIKMPAEIQHKVKLDIFKTVSDAEEIMLKK